jgi:pentose-5-phosphate-3-epimerase
VGVDGGVTIGNAAEVAGWGPDIIVSGSAIFDRRSPADNLELLTQAMHRPPRGPTAGRIGEAAHSGLT